MATKLMDSYGSQAWRSIPDDHFFCQDEVYTAYKILRDPRTSDVLVEQEHVTKQELRSWAQDQVRTRDGTAPLSAFKCLIVTTHDFNDWPVDISREDLWFVASIFGISPAHIPLLFAPYTGYTALDQKICWSYGRPGLRAVACTDASQRFTRAILTVENSARKSIEEHLQQFAGFVDHPLMLALAHRADTVMQCQTHLNHYVLRLRDAERLTGFQTDLDETSDLQNPMHIPDAHLIDLGRLSRKVGSDASNLGNFKVILARLESVQRFLVNGDGQLRWQKQFDIHPDQLYKGQTEEMIDVDGVIESTRQGLLEVLTEYQNRARNLQSVIFNLIAKEDANASIELAKESRAIAAATRNDGTSMKTVAIMTMVFLPATFYAALFAVPSLKWDESPVIQSKFWVYWAFTLPSTIIVLITWYVVVARQVRNDSVIKGTEKKISPRNSRSHTGIAKNFIQSLTRMARPDRPGDDNDNDDHVSRDDVHRHESLLANKINGQIMSRQPRTAGDKTKNSKV